VISWRYHVVSIVAVVLAFGLGILAGTAVVNDEFVQQLQQNTDQAQRERDAALAEVARYERFVSALQPTLRDDRLSGLAAVVVTVEGADRPSRRVLDELAAAGADVLATITLTARFGDLETSQNLDALRGILELPDAEPVELLAGVADALAVRLAVGPDGQDDVLAELLTAGFITADRDLDEAALAGIGGVTQIDVIAAGDTAAGEVVPPSVLAVPIVERLAELRDRVAVVGPTDDTYGLVEAIREGGIPDCALVTVDHIDLGIGGIAFVMGLERLLADPDPEVRPGGDYGVDGDAIVPGPEPPASCRR
jgi:hypothetical protein